MALVRLPFYVSVWHTLRSPTTPVCVFDPYDGGTTTFHSLLRLPELPELYRLAPSARLPVPPTSDAWRLLAGREFGTMTASDPPIAWTRVGDAMHESGMFCMRVFVAASGGAQRLKRQAAVQLRYALNFPGRPGEQPRTRYMNIAGRAMMLAVAYAPDGTCMPIPTRGCAASALSPQQFAAWRRSIGLPRPLLSPRCVACGKEKSRKVCTGCGIARYCSKECQLQDRRQHKPSCSVHATV